MSRIRPLVDQECLRTLYFGHAYSSLQYAILAWGSVSNSKLKRINVLHNRLLRLMSLHGPLNEIDLNINELYGNLRLLKFSDIYKLETAKFMHRCTNGNLPKSFDSYFVQKSYSYNLRSRSSNPYRIQFCNTLAYKRWLTNNGIHIWEGISEDMKKLPYQSFKRILKNELLNEYYA